jgi:hypothetical protein
MVQAGVRFESQMSWAHRGKLHLAELETALKQQSKPVPQSHCSAMAPIIFFYAPQPGDVAGIQQNLRTLPGVTEDRGELSYKGYTLSVLHKPADEAP